MSWEIKGPAAGSSAEDKANRNGDNLTDPAGWRAALDVPDAGSTASFSGGKVAAAGLEIGGGSSIQTSIHAASFATPNPFTIAVWVNILDFTFNLGRIIQQDDNNVRNWAIRIRTSGEVEFLAFSDGAMANYTSCFLEPGVVAAGRWTHLVMTIEGGTVKVYVNGVDTHYSTLVAGGGFNGTFGTGHSQLRIGQRYIPLGMSVANCQVRGVAPFSRALNAEEVAALHGNGGVVPTSLLAGLIDEWRLDDGLQLYQGRNGSIAVPSAGDGVTDLMPHTSQTYRFTVGNTTGSATNTELAGYRPAGTLIENISFVRTAGTGAFAIGTVSAGAQIVASTNAANGKAALASNGATASRASLWVNMAPNTTYRFTMTLNRYA